MTLSPLSWRDDSASEAGAPLPDENAAPGSYRPRAGRAIRRGLGLWWDRIGLTAALNLGWMALVVLLGILVDRILGAGRPPLHGHGAANSARAIVLVGNLVILLAAGALAAGPAATIARCFRFELPGVNDFTGGILRDGGRYAALTAIALVWIGGCVLYFEWFIASPALRLLSPLLLYAAGFWIAAMPYQFALVTLENHGTSAAVKKSMLLLLDNPLFSLATSAVGAILAAFLAFSRVGLGLAALSIWLVLGQASTLEALRKYRPGEDDEELDTAARDVERVDAEQAVRS